MSARAERLCRSVPAEPKMSFVLPAAVVHPDQIGALRRAPERPLPVRVSGSAATVVAEPRPVGSGPVLAEVLDATRALLWIRTAGDAAEIARDLVESLGGRTVEACSHDDEAIPIDVSFGAGEPLLAAAPPASPARVRLERDLPAFVRDAQRALDLAGPGHF